MYKKALYLILISIWVFASTPFPATAEVGVLRLSLIPNDPYFVNQTYLQRINAPLAWDIALRSTLQKEITIALLDTGVDIDHPDLVARIARNIGEIPGDGIDNDKNSYIDDVNGWDFIESSPDPRPKIKGSYSYEAVHHGTVVAGVIGAVMNNGVGIAGVMPNVRIMPLRVLDDEGAGNTLMLSQAIDYAVENGADVINLSLVGDIEDPRLVESIARAYRANVAVIAASGNQESSGLDLNVTPRYPVCESGPINRVLGVAAVNEQNRLAVFSNYGSHCIDISAPGTDFFSTIWKDASSPPLEYAGGWSGTSVAAPLVSATVALIKQVAPNLSLHDVYRSVTESAQSLRASEPQFAELGSGLLDVGAALNKAIEFSRRQPVQLLFARGAGSEPRVTVTDAEGRLVTDFLAYAKEFRGGVSVAVGDVDGDNVPEIITAPFSQGGPHIRIFDFQGRLKGQFMAYSPDFRGGLSIVTGNVDGKAGSEIIVVPRAGGGPHVRVFNAKGDLLSQFMAYAEQFRGGVSLASGDLDGDAVDEIVVAPASGGGPHVRFFDAQGVVKGQFMAFDPSERGGYSIDIGNVDGVFGQEILISQINVQNPQIRIFDSNTVEKNRFLLNPEGVSGAAALRLVADDFTGDAIDDIIVYSRSTAEVRIVDFYGQVIRTMNVSGGALMKGIEYSMVLLR